MTCTYALVREVHVFPCDKPRQEYFNVSVYSSNVVIVPANLMFCDTTWNSGYNVSLGYYALFYKLHVQIHIYWQARFLD